MGAEVRAVLIQYNGKWGIMPVNADDPGEAFLDVAGAVVDGPLFEVVPISETAMMFCLECGAGHLPVNRMAMALFGMDAPVRGPVLIVAVGPDGSHVDIAADLAVHMRAHWSEQEFKDADVPRQSTAGKNRSP